MENFVVSARKYRPATFASVVGQSHITDTLRNAIVRGQLAHAYLFCGPRGVGKTTCARIFAKAINCLNPGPDAEACNSCESCQAFNEGRSFNIHELDAASNNSVENIRDLIDQMRVLPPIGRYSVYIIDEVHMLSQAAFNAFLKTLEEPPAHVIFILATTEKHKIIPTILSRCQTYDFNRIRVEDTVGYLKHIASQEKITYDDESLHIIAQKADGGMRDALSMFDQVVSFCGGNLTAQQVAATLNILDYDTYFNITGDILAGDYTHILLQFDDVLRRGFSEQTFVSGLNNHLRNLLMCKNPQTLPLLEVTGSVADRYQTQAAETPVPLLFEGINLLTAIDGSLRAATNKRLHVELGLMKLCGLGQKKNNDTLTPSLPPLKGSPAGDAPRTADTASTASPNTTLSPQPSATQPAATRSALSPSTTAQPATTVPSNQGTSGTNPLPVTSAATGPSVPRAMCGTTRTNTVETLEAQQPLQTSPVTTGSTVFDSSSSSSSLGGTTLSGRSIQSLLHQASIAPPAVEASDANEEAVDEPLETLDEHTEIQLQEGCMQLAERLLAEQRPRLGIAFQSAHVCGSTITLKVANESLADEVNNHLSDLRIRLGELSGVHTHVEFRLTIMADTHGLKPIKVEDRLRYLTDKNPLVAKLRHDLDLDVE